MDKSVSVVTVSFQAKDTIRQTIESVLNQSYLYYEYIIIDGKSTDGTYSIICEYDNAFKKKGIRYFHISEKDSGIFDAMNKAIIHCNNEWIIYIGADDVLAEEKILSKVFCSNIPSSIDCIYGDVILRRNGMEFKRPADSLKVLNYKMAFSHQSMFTRKNVLQKYLFDEKLCIMADVDLCMRMYRDHCAFLKVPYIISSFSAEGTTFQKSKRRKMQWEYRLVMKKSKVSLKYKFVQYIYLKVIIPIKLNNTIYAVRMKLLNKK